MTAFLDALTTRRFAALVVAALAIAAMFHTTGCTPEEIAAVKAAVEARPVDCYGAVARIWPAELQPWARRIVWRESRDTPTAQNTSSTSAGCFQLTRIHADLFAAVGCSWARRYNALCNTKAAWLLYQRNGAAPWVL